MSDSARLFVGVQVSPAATEEIAELVESIGPVARSQDLDVRWLPPANYHVTLKFLGWTRREVVSALDDALAPIAAARHPFDLTLQSVGAFPSEDKARVVWLGAGKGKESLEDLASAVHQATERIGFSAEARAFHPHLTIGRLKKASNAKGLILPFADERIRKTKVDRLLLFESVTGKGPVQYEVRAQWALRGEA